MKRITVALAAVIAIIGLISSLSPAKAADTIQPAASIEERLAQVNLSLILKQYERLLGIIYEAELAELVAEQQPRSAEQADKQSIRKARFRAELERLREMAIKQDKEIQRLRSPVQHGEASPPDKQK